MTQGYQLDHSDSDSYALFKIMFSLNMVDDLRFSLLLSNYFFLPEQVEEGHSKSLLLFEFSC